ncbi:hypothetical protein [Flavobacterium anhuiense]|uniref:hypothetical protein n=1 Tax=Flavobacterium anhuiense TaxID=459526 RepID=UPI000E6C07CC|nr:hypothetical protein [Flavobacterium anhuiense]
MKKIDLNDPKLKGKYYDVNDEGTEFSIPPRDFLDLGIEKVDEDLSLFVCNSTGCSNQVKITDRGNAEYAWYYLDNLSETDATITIERRWIYEGSWRRETAQCRLYPGEIREVFSFPRNQNPMCCITVCSLTNVNNR